VNNFTSPPSVPEKSNVLSFLSFILLPVFAFGLGWSVSESNSSEYETELLDGENEMVISSNDFEEIDVSLLRDAVSLVREKYVDPEQIDPDRMKYGIVRGLIWSLEDPYSEFMSPQESEEFEDELGGELQGIGAELTVRDGAIIVVSPLRDSPAERAGLFPEDIILKVDGEDALGKDFLNVIKRIRGEKGTEVVLTIFRPETSEELEIKIIRDQIRVHTVEVDWKDDIAVLEVSQFGSNTEAEFNKTLSEVLVKNPKGIILDLRFNSGGFLDTAIKMVSVFQKEGRVVIQKGRPPETHSLFVNGRVRTDLPLVVLQNGGSASASEIVAGALQDHGRAVVIGEQSFGKGTVQEVIPMRDGSHLRVTVAKWLTPNERDIGKVGIEPDLLIERSLEDFKEKRDPQMDTALRYLRGESLEDLKAEFGGEEDIVSEEE